MKLSIFFPSLIGLFVACSALAAPDSFSCHGLTMVNDTRIICQIAVAPSGVDPSVSELSILCPEGYAAGYNGNYVLSPKTLEASGLKNLKTRLESSYISMNYKFTFDAERISSATTFEGRRLGREPEMLVAKVFDKDNNFLGYEVQSNYGNFMGCLK